jgi:Tol biopolymer transport system component
VFVQPLESGYAPRDQPRRITRQGAYIVGLAWSRDGHSLIYSAGLSWGMNTRLWRVASDGKHPPERFDLAGIQTRQPAVAPAGNRLAFSRSAVNYDIWRYQLGGVPRPLLASSLHELGAQFSPDGNRIAFASARDGDITEIWVANADGSHWVQLTKEVGRGQGTPHWSPEGRLIVFDSLGADGKSRIYVIEANGGRPRRVGSDAANDSWPSWSRNGKWVYFYSDRTGRTEVWRVRLDDGTPQQVTGNGGRAALESTDGRAVFYMKSDRGPLFIRSLDGGPEREVLDYVSERAFAVFADGIYYIGRPAPDRQYPIQFYAFSTGASRLLLQVEGPVQQGLSLSPDRKTILFSKSATAGTDLMMIENFR